LEGGSQKANESTRNKPTSGTHRNEGEILLSIADQIVAGGSHDLFEKLAPSVRDLAQCDVVVFSLYDAEQRRVVTDLWKSGEKAERAPTYPVDESPCGWVWAHQQPLRIPDLDQERRFPGVVQYLRNLGMLSCAALPMSTPKHRYGAMGIGVSERDAESLRNLVPLARARLVGLAVENQKVYSEWEKQQGRLRALAEINREISEPDAVQTLPTVLTEMRRITDCEYARVELLDPDADSLRVGSVDPWVCEWLELEEGQRIPLGKSVAAQAVAMRRVTFHDVDEIAKGGCIVAGEARNYGLGSFACVPLILGNHVLGVLLLGAVGKNAFSTSDAPYLYQIGVQIAAVLHSTGETRAAVAGRPLSQNGERRAAASSEGAGRWDEIVGNSSALTRVMEQAELVAKTDATVLITGETGTGKECLARAIHAMSERRNNPFIKVNCAAIPTGLLESELFGHEKGAFTGAVSQKVGRLELAHKGTLLLDEVGEIPLELQPKLLRVLQDQEFERLGGTKTIRVDVRVIAASNRDLERAVEEKQFRSDLYYRLHVFPLHLPPLRERREDIPLLIRHFVEKCSLHLKKRFDLIPADVVESMTRMDWPGNIRELENFIERSVILSEGGRLCLAAPEEPGPARGTMPVEGTLHERERSHIIEVLRKCGGVLSGPAGAANRLGLKRTTLQYKMQKLGISRHEYLD